MSSYIDNEIDEIDTDDDSIEKTRSLLANSDQIHSLETVLYKLVEFYTRATKEQDSAMVWQAKFATTTQLFAEQLKKFGSAKEALADAMNATLKNVAQETGATLGQAATHAAEKEMEPITKRFGKIFDEGESQLKGYATETKTFFWKMLVTSLISSIATALLIVFCLVPTLQHQWLPLTDNQLTELQLGSRLQLQWAVASDKDKKQIKEALGDSIVYYLDKNKKRKA